MNLPLTGMLFLSKRTKIMRKLFFIVLFYFSYNAYSQNVNLYKCEEIENFIADETLIDTLSNGKPIMRLDRYNNKIYKIVIDNNKFYYVGKPIMKKIKKSIKINNCKKIKIKKIDKLSDINFKIIRD